MFDFETAKIKEELTQLNGQMNSYYCGSYFGYGLHEDAITSAMKVAEHFGVKFTG
jgi:predicted NAD/FAD-binding protein